MLYPKLCVIASLGLLSMLLCCVLKATAQGDGPSGRANGQLRLMGTWWAGAAPDGDKLRISLKREGEGGTSSVHIPLVQLQGLEPGQISRGAARASFRLVREAGTIIFEGSFKRGKGA